MSLKKEAIKKQAGAIILVADVQNFSDYSQSEEVRIVEAIWAELTAHDIWSRSDSNNIHFNGTGDGLLVAVLGDAIEHE